MKGRNSTEIAPALLTQQSQVRMLAGTPDFLKIETSRILSNIAAQLKSGQQPQNM